MTTILFDSRIARKANRFALGLLPIVQPANPERLPIGASPADKIWASAFELALDAVPADPGSDLTPFEAEAFVAGYEAGAAQLDADRAEYSDWYDEQLTWEVGYYTRNETPEGCDHAGSIVGHDDGASFADELLAAIGRLDG